MDAAIARLFTYAAWADKYDGAVHQVPIRGVTLAMHEPIGVIGIAAARRGIRCWASSRSWPRAIAVGNTVVVDAVRRAHPLSATDFYGVLETSDLPGGRGQHRDRRARRAGQVLAEHCDVDAVWYCGSADGGRAVEEASAGNMKQTWLPRARATGSTRASGKAASFCAHATQVKNIWIPYGE